ncbi:MAG: hypothetical protein H3Z50_02220 [archaeon]|nr:hypothetical protein [archaeon]
MNTKMGMTAIIPTGFRKLGPSRDDINFPIIVLEAPDVVEGSMMWFCKSDDVGFFVHIDISLVPFLYYPSIISNWRVRKPFSNRL